MVRFLGVYSLVVLGGLLLAGCQPQSPAQGVGTQQVLWGGAIYRQECAHCHDLGRVARPLIGERLVLHHNAHNLYAYTRQYMPLDHPGSLPESDYWAVTAYILAEEELLLLPAQTTLRPEIAEQVNFIP